MQHGAQVYVDQQVDALGIRGEDGAGPVHAGIVHQDVELDALGQAGDASQIAHVHRVRDAAGAGRERLERVGPAREGMDGHALPAQALDDGGADPGGGAGHEGCLIIGNWHVRSSSALPRRQRLWAKPPGRAPRRLGCGPISRSYVAQAFWRDSGTILRAGALDRGADFAARA